MATWLVGWSFKKFNTVLIIFGCGMIFRMLIGEGDWIAVLVVSFLLGFTLRKE